MDNLKKCQNFISNNTIKCYSIDTDANHHSVTITSEDGKSVTFQVVYEFEIDWLESMTKYKKAIDDCENETYKKISMELFHRANTESVSSTGSQSSKDGDFATIRFRGHKEIKYQFDDWASVKEFHRYLVEVRNYSGYASRIRELEKMIILIKKYGKMPEIETVYVKDSDRVYYYNIVLTYDDGKFVISTIPEKGAKEMMIMLKDILIL